MLAHRLAFAVVFALAAAAVHAQPAVTVNDVVALHNAGLADAEIQLELVRRQAAFAPLADAELARLRAAGVGADLVAWIAKGGVAPRPEAAAAGVWNALPPGPAGPVPEWPARAMAPAGPPRAPTTVTLASLVAMVRARESATAMLDGVLDPGARLALSAADRAKLEREGVPLPVRLVVERRRLDAASLVALVRAAPDSRDYGRVLAELGFTGPLDAAATLDLTQAGLATPLLADLRAGKHDRDPAPRIGGTSIRIAVVLPEGGPRAARGLAARRGLELARERVNAAGGVARVPIELDFRAEPAEPAEAVALAQALADDPAIVAVIGHTDRAAAAQVGVVYDRNELACVGTDDAGAGIPGVGILAIAPRPELDGAFLARYLRQACGIRKLAAISERDPAGDAVRKAFASEVGKLGLELVADERVERGGDLADAILRVVAAAPGAVLVATTPADAVAIATELRRQKLSALLVGASEMLEIAGTPGDATEGIRVCTAAGTGGPDDGPDAVAFRAAYRATYGGAPEPAALYGADSLGLLATTIPGSGCDRGRLRAALIARDTPAEAYRGAGGPLYLDVDGDAVRGRVVLERKGETWVPAKIQRNEVATTSAPESLSPFARRMSAPARLAASQAAGGSAATEKAVDLALAWLAAHQHEDGSWRVRGFDRDRYPGDPGRGKLEWVDPGTSALALLAFLGAGHTHARGAHAATVKRGLVYLLGLQDAEGCIGRRNGHHMYNHAIATLALSEAQAMERDPRLGDAAVAATRFLLAAQNPRMAWRYGVRCGDDDTSVTGWCVKALAAARVAKLSVDGIDPAIASGLEWVESMTDGTTCVTGYKSRVPLGWTSPTSSRFQNDELHVNTSTTHDLNHTPTAIAACIRLLAGKPAADLRVAGACARVAEILPAHPATHAAGTRSPVDYYYWLYGTEALFQARHPSWKTWNAALVPALVGRQRVAAKDGPFVGSWDPVDAWSWAGGRVYATAMAALILESYYRVEPVEAPKR